MSATDAEQEFLKNLKTVFPDASTRALEDEVRFFSTAFAIEPNRIPVADHEKEKANIDEIKKGLHSALTAYANLHPSVQRALDRQFKATAAQAKKRAPGAARPFGDMPNLYAGLAAMIWAMTGRHPNGDRNIDVKPADRAAHDAVSGLAQATGQAEKSMTYHKVALVERAKILWHKYRGEDAPLTGKDFVGLVNDLATFAGSELDADAAIQAYKRQSKKF